MNLHLRSLVREILERETPVAAVQPAPPPAPPAAGPPLWPGSPFPGLRAFTPKDAPIFFGRGRETDDLVSRLDQPARRFLAVVGASGSGKSSLVAAGLILDDTGTEPGRLALLAFALAELHAARTADGHLTQAAYAGFNGVGGAIAKRAEDTLTALGVPQPTLGEVFQELVEIEEGGAVTRRRAPWARLNQSADANRLVG